MKTRCEILVSETVTNTKEFEKNIRDMSFCILCIQKIDKLVSNTKRANNMKL